LDDQKKKPDEAQAVEDALSGANGPATTETDADKKAKSTADKHAKDVYLKETQQIIADWLQAISPKVAKLNAPK
jgi:vacuolar-type H+-ATPase subunit E/Vma4